MIAVLDFGMGNIHSIIKAISQFTNEYQLTSDPEIVKKSKAIVLPGDGAFEKAMYNLEETGLKSAILESVQRGTYLFGICIGFQLLFEDSEETTTKGKLQKGLGIIKGNVKKFPGKTYKVPHMGWNKIYFNSKSKHSLLNNVPNESYMYFIHSYRPVQSETEAVVANCKYGNEKFPVIVEKQNIFGTQFHPEKSGQFGLNILKNFIEITQK